MPADQDAAPDAPRKASANKPTSSNAFKDSLRRFQYTPPSRSSTRRTLPSSHATPTAMTTGDKNSPLEQEDDDDDDDGSGNPPPKKRKKPSSPAPSSSSSPQPPPPPRRPPNGKKRARKSSTYAPPSTYAHLAPIPDILAPSLICIFIGTNPGIQTSTTGHIYAHPTNQFWKLLFVSGCTENRLLQPSDDGLLPARYALGSTNIVSRPTRDAGELSKQEMVDGARVLEDKIRTWRPEAVCVVGKGIWEAVWRAKHRKRITKDEFKWGWQHRSENMGRAEHEREQDTEAWEGAKVFVASSTSGLSASLKPAEKEAIWRPFGEWVRRRRAERADAVAVAREGVRGGGGGGAEEEA